MAGRHYTALGYCDEQDIENFLLLDIDNSFSPQIEDWIVASEKQVNDYLNYTTASGVLNEQITGEVARAFIDSELNLRIFPRKIPINSIEQIQLVKGTSTLTITLADGNGNVKYNIPATNDQIFYPQYEFNVTGSSIINSFADLRTTRFYAKLNYTAGYTEVPADIRLATVNLVSDIIMRHVNKEGLESITQGRVSKRWHQRRDGQSDFVTDAYTLLRGYKISSNWL